MVKKKRITKEKYQSDPHVVRIGTTRTGALKIVSFEDATIKPHKKALHFRKVVKKRREPLKFEDVRRHVNNVMPDADLVRQKIGQNKYRYLIVYQDGSWIPFKYLVSIESFLVHETNRRYGGGVPFESPELWQR